MSQFMKIYYTFFVICKKINSKVTAINNYFRANLTCPIFPEIQFPIFVSTIYVHTFS